MRDLAGSEFQSAWGDLPRGYELQKISAAEFLRRVELLVKADHRCAIVEQEAVAGLPRYRMECSCGWTGSQYQGAHMCEYDDRRHWQEVEAFKLGYQAHD